MLNFVVGDAKSGKTTYLFDVLEKVTNNRLICDDVLILLPNQESCNNFVLERFGEPIPGLEIETFRTFSKKIINNPNSGLSELKFGSTVMLDLAIEATAKSSVSSELIDIIKNWRNVYGKTAVYSVISELIRENITPEKLSVNRKDNVTEEIAETCNALACVLRNYKNILRKHNYYDSAESEIACAKLIDAFQHNYKFVFIDSFNRFNQSQIEIIKALAKRADVYLSIDSAVEKNNPYLRHTKLLQDKIKRNVTPDSDQKVIKLEAEMISTHDDIKLLKQCFDKNISLKSSEKIQILKGESPYHEITRIAMEIRNLIANGKCSIDDVAILYRSNEPYADLVPYVLQKNGITCRNRIYEKLAASHIVKYLNSLHTILNDFNDSHEAVFTENKLLLMKSLFLDEITRNLINVEFKKKFTSNDFAKFNEKFMEAGIFSFAMIYSGLQDDNEIDNFVSNKIKLFSDIQIDILTCIYNLIDSLSNDEEFVKKIIKVYIKKSADGAHLSSIFQEIYSFYKSLNIKHIPIINFIKEISQSISIPVSKNDTGVYCANIATSQLPATIKTVFVVGLNQNKFPLNKKISPILSENVTSFLISKLDVDLQQNFRDFEDYLFYKALTTATENLYLSYSEKNLQGISQNPSIYLYHKAFSEIMKEDKPISINRLNLPGKYLRIFTRLNNNDNQDPKHREYLKSLQFLSDYKNCRFISERRTLIQSKNLTKYLKHSISQEIKEYLRLSKFTTNIIGKSIDKSDIIFSQSSLKNYLTCPYKFLVETVYKVKEINEFALEAVDLGNIFHAAMEHFAYLVADVLRDQDFTKLEENRESIIGNTLSDLKKSFLQSFQTYESKSKYRSFIDSLKDFRKFLEREIDRRIKQKAAPAAVELAFGIPFSDKTKTPYVIEQIPSKHDEYLEIQNAEYPLKIRGFIDLVDVVDVEGEKYYFVIDYKKTYDFKKYFDIVKWMKYETIEEYWVANNIKDEAVLPILNFAYFDLQLPLYLLAMKNVFNIDNANTALFYHLFHEGFAGFIEGDLVTQVTGEFFPEKLFKKVNKSFTNKEIEQLLKSSERFLISIVENMRSGVFPISPDVSHPKRNKVCDYCPYKSVCRIDSD